VRNVPEIRHMEQRVGPGFCGRLALIRRIQAGDVLRDEDDRLSVRSSEKSDHKTREISAARLPIRRSLKPRLADV
jgi:hypothetical protein